MIIKFNKFREANLKIQTALSKCSLEYNCRPPHPKKAKPFHEISNVAAKRFEWRIGVAWPNGRNATNQKTVWHWFKFSWHYDKTAYCLLQICETFSYNASQPTTYRHDHDTVQLLSTVTNDDKQDSDDDRWEMTDNMLKQCNSKMHHVWVYVCAVLGW